MYRSAARTICDGIDQSHNWEWLGEPFVAELNYRRSLYRCTICGYRELRHFTKIPGQPALKVTKREDWG